MTPWLIAYTAWLAIINVTSFILYVNDKIKSKFNFYRTPEKKLLLLSALGGGLGGSLAMLFFRHKTQHAIFILTNLFSIVAHTIIFAVLYFNKL
ncbi:MAG: DUF1294 domain-containing protein [Clostridia bacterium]|nr:DUF1294 domain-containing protein [Clostridia bacterium]